MNSLSDEAVSLCQNDLIWTRTLKSSNYKPWEWLRVTLLDPTSTFSQLLIWKAELHMESKVLPR